MRAAENQRIHTCVLQRREIFLHHSLDDHIAAVHAAVLDQRHEQRTRLREQVERAVLFVQILLVCTRTDGGRRADHADSAGLRHGHGAAAGRLDRADDWDVVLLGKQVKRDSGHGVAGNDDGFQVKLAQKRHILPGILGDDIAAARTVRHTAGIAEIDDIFLRHQGVQTAHGGQTAQAGVKYANRTLIHCAPPVPEKSGGRAARHSRCPRSQTAWGTC